MGSILSPDKIGNLSKVGSNINLDSLLATLGGRQYYGTNFSITPVVAANTLYYIYAVLNPTLDIVLSTSPSGPIGFSQYKEIGKVITNRLSVLGEPVKYGEDFVHYIKSILTSNNMLNRGAGDLRFLITDLLETGNFFIELLDNSGSNKTDFINNYADTCESNMGLSGDDVNTNGLGLRVRLNGTTIFGSSRVNSSNGNTEISVDFEAEKGYVLNYNAVNQSIPLGTNVHVRCTFRAKYKNVS